MSDLQAMAAEVGEKSIWEGLRGGLLGRPHGFAEKKRFFDDVYEDFDSFFVFCLHEMDIFIVGLFIFPKIARP